jgi:hypothetical protein
VHRIARKRRVQTRIEHHVGAGGRVTPLDATEVDPCGSRVRADLQPRSEAPLHAAARFEADVRRVEVRVHPPVRRERAADARHEPPGERAFHFECRAPFAAPRQRHRDPGTRAQRVDEREPCAVGEPVAVRISEDRHPHRRQLEPPERPRQRNARAARRTLVDDNHHQDGSRILDREIPPADLDVLEALRGSQRILRLLQPVGARGLSDAEAAHRHDVAARRGVVAVDTNLGHALRVLRGGGRRLQRQDEHDPSGHGTTTRPPVSASV